MSSSSGTVWHLALAQPHRLQLQQQQQQAESTESLLLRQPGLSATPVWYRGSAFSSLTLYRGAASTMIGFSLCSRSSLSWQPHPLCCSSMKLCSSVMHNRASVSSGKKDKAFSSSFSCCRCECLRREYSRCERSERRWLEELCDLYFRDLLLRLKGSKRPIKHILTDIELRGCRGGDEGLEFSQLQVSAVLPEGHYIRPPLQGFRWLRHRRL